MGRVQFGLIVPENPSKPPNRNSYMEDLDRLLERAEGHFASAWCIDHLNGDVLEAWTVISYLAARHPGFVWGNTVLNQSFRNPALVARMGATLDFMSGGKFVLGIGAGGQKAEYLAYGYDFPRGRTRVEQLDEALRIIRAMWTREQATFEGEHYRVERATCEPRPYPRPPIMVGAFGPKMLRLTARHADWWNVSSTSIEMYREYVREFDRACVETGRDPLTVRRVWSGGCVCAPTHAQVAELVGDRRRGKEEETYQVGEDFVGTASEMIEQMQPFIDLGVDSFLLDCGGFPRLTTIETLIDQVMPAFNR